MSWLVALAAFAGIMAVFSTVVTVAVEAYHKALSLRRSGLQEMLRAMHMRVIKRLDATLPEADQKALVKAASSFAKSMTQSPSYGGQGRWWWPANWGINISQRQFERLSKRQLAEQLSQTDFGKRLIQADRVTIQGVMAELAYEFDRIGAAQSDYFRRRAKMISGVFAFAFVAVGNINAIEIYKHLAESEANAGRAINFVEQVAAQRETYKATLASDMASDEPDFEPYLSAIEEVRAQSQIPTGRAYFPYCEGLQLQAPEKTAGDTSKIETQTRINVDEGLCSDLNQKIEVWFFKRDWTVDLPAAFGNAVRKPGPWIVWLLSIIATAGLLGLGAPFWFDVFNKAAAMAGRQVTQAKAAAVEEDKKSEPSVPGKRGGENANISEMTDAFLASSGQIGRAGSMAAGAPLGARLGAASADLTGGAPPSPSAPAPSSGHGVRLPPGAVKGNRT
jgi:hypothetical protein